MRSIELGGFAVLAGSQAGVKHLLADLLRCASDRRPTRSAWRS